MSAAPRTRTTTSAAGERRRTLDRFGSHVELRVQPGMGRAGQAEHRLDRAEALLAEFDRRLSRFDDESELCKLNADPRDRVPASPMMQRFAEAVGWAGRRSGGLVDASVLDAVEAAGYVESMDLDADGVSWARRTTKLRVMPDDVMGVTVADVMGRSATDVVSQPKPRAATWRDVRSGDGHVNRPAGLRLDSGGIGKGLAADLAGELLRGTPSWVVDCGGDLRIGGTGGVPRAVDVTDPHDPSRVLHRLHVTRGGVATSGVTRRSWDTAGQRQHHLIDPRTGEPADTGVLQVTALAPTALEAEVLAKAALLAGPEAAHARLDHGGVVVCDNGIVLVVPPPRVHQQPVAGKRTRARFSVPGGPSVLRMVDRGDRASQRDEVDADRAPQRVLEHQDR